MIDISKRLVQKGSPFELQNAVIKGIPCKIFPYGPKTLQDVFLKSASFKQSEFIISGETRLSFENVLERAQKFAYVLIHQYGVRNGDRVALIMSNSPEWVVAFFALYFAGAVPVIIHADGTKPVIIKTIEITNCALVISDYTNIKKIEESHREYSIVLVSDNSNKGKSPEYNIEKENNKKIGYLNLFESVNDDHLLKFDEIPKPAPDDEALISFTSGTTGTPKGVVLTHRNITTGLMNMMLGGALMSYRIPKVKTVKKPVQKNMQPSSLLLSPLSHIGGYSQIMLMCYLGGKIVLMNEWNASRAAEYIKNEKVRSLNGASIDMIRELLRFREYNENLETLTNLNINGVALHKGFINYIAEKLTGVILATGYGMTETCGSISNVTGKELLNNPNWIGPVLPSVDVKIVDDSGNEQPPGVLGELYIKGAMVMKEYCSDPDSTNNAVKNGWLKTGDLGYLDSNGNLYVTDRIKDVIICSGHNVLAGELEHLANDNPLVDEAVAFGIPNSERCEKIVLAVLSNNMFQNEELNLDKEISSGIKKYSDNIKIIRVSSLPRTASGKVNRNELRRQILERI
ncbi:MAG: class I adenylate-forming enzyme family protein [Desulfobacteraceae bacterium]|jgi:long-chain acyl-CoA synthetase